MTRWPDHPIPNWELPLEPLFYQAPHREGALCWVSLHHLFHVLGNYVGFEIYGVSGLERSEIGQFDGVGNDSYGATVVFQFRHRQADAFNANRPLVHGVLLDFGGDFDMQPPVLGIPALRVQDALEFDHLAHAIDVPLNDVAAEASVGFHGQLQVDLGALVHARE